MYLLLAVRVKAVHSRKISPRYFKLNKGGKEPDGLIAVGQNYSNLLELPVLFYLVCCCNGTKSKCGIFCFSCMDICFFRYLHSYIHITYNQILHRLFVYAVSGFVLLSMWIKVVLLVS